jgi:DNA-binding IclR family transcriptional regulator
MPEPEPRGVREVKSAARTVDLLELLAARDSRPVRLRDLAEEMDVPRSSLYALLQTLVTRGWVRTDATGSLYGIGIRALLAGTSYIDSDPRVELVRPFVDEAAETLGETVHFARLDGEDVVYLATRESRQYLRTWSRVGRRMPSHVTALGKALLAERDDDALPADPLRPMTPHTVPDSAALAAQLAEVRSRGYAIEREEGVVGIAGFGFALRYETPAVDAISCSVPVARLTPRHQREIIEVMLAARAGIEGAAPPVTGGSGPDWIQRSRAEAGWVEERVEGRVRHGGGGSPRGA